MAFYAEIQVRNGLAAVNEKTGPLTTYLSTLGCGVAGIPRDHIRGQRAENSSEGRALTPVPSGLDASGCRAGSDRATEMGRARLAVGGKERLSPMPVRLGPCRLPKTVRRLPDR